MTVTIDGEEVPNLERYHTETGYYPFEVPTINIYDDQCDWAMGGVGCTSAEPGVTYYAVAAGTAVLIKPLPPGEHTIRMVVDYVDGFHNDLTNIINVVE
jgi:hypothetical protein